MAVEVDGAGMLRLSFVVVPVSFDYIAVGIEVVEEGIGQGYSPGGGVLFAPIFDLFRAAYLDFFFFGCPVGDAAGGWIDSFPVDAGVHGDGVTSLRDAGGGLDGLVFACFGYFDVVLGEACFCYENEYGGENMFCHVLKTGIQSLCTNFAVNFITNPAPGR